MLDVLIGVGCFFKNLNNYGKYFGFFVEEIVRDNYLGVIVFIFIFLSIIFYLMVVSFFVLLLDLFMNIYFLMKMNLKIGIDKNFE